MRTLVALYEPLIPQNTGNIGRLCVGFDCELALIGRLGFEITSARVKRAGLDYWPLLRLSQYPDFESFLAGPAAGRPILAFSKRAEIPVYDHPFVEESVLLFGPETTGLPDSLWAHGRLTALKLPILGQIRSHNLANSVAMGLSEVYRQTRHPARAG
ncbi:MAG: tRNA (cytidine(34)-2'-O)-methyltransferase [Spirochaetes bacterium]|nr:tRNA (cytidine(34)-2'-O)-methyltransferase [Spirochaetota bacterium]